MSKSSLKSLDLIKNLNKETFDKFINQIINNLNYFLDNSILKEDFDYLKAESNDEINVKEVVNEWSIYVAKVYELDREELPLIDTLDDEKKDALVKILKEKNQLIKQFLFFMALKKDHPNLVKEFDWNVNLVLATDQISDLNKPLANLQFNNSNNEKICHLELNEDELDQLIESVDKVKNELKNLL